MNTEEFREFGKAAIDYIAEYNESLRDRDVLPNVKPGYLIDQLPKEVPQTSENWKDILNDIDKMIVPGMTHWSSPHFHAYFPTANSYPAIVGDVLSIGMGCLGFSWITSPACTELEITVTDWMAKLLGLPEHFLNSSPGNGGGVLMETASEAILISLLAAREMTVKRVKQENPEMSEGTIRSKLIAYASDQSNSSVEKAGRLGAIKMRLLPADQNCCLRGATLREQMKLDVEAGLIPCIVIATLGTTPTCAFDRLDELGPICIDNNIWLHVDAAYAGAAFVCPEYRHHLNGIQFVDSFNFNPHKWLLTNFGCAAQWMKDASKLTESFRVERVYLPSDKNKHPAERDYRHWQIALGKRFRSLKLWIVLRTYGVEGLQKHIRHTITLAKKFEELVRSDDRFEIPVEPNMGLICFKLKGDDSLSRQLLDKLMQRRKIYVISGAYRDQMVIRFAICSRFCMQEDIEFAWDEIVSQANEVLKETHWSIRLL